MHCGKVRFSPTAAVSRFLCSVTCLSTEMVKKTSPRLRELARDQRRPVYAFPPSVFREEFNENFFFNWMREGGANCGESSHGFSKVSARGGKKGGTVERKSHSLSVFFKLKFCCVMTHEVWDVDETFHQTNNLTSHSQNHTEK